MTYKTTRRVARQLGRDNAPCVRLAYFASFLAFLAAFFCCMVFNGFFSTFFFASCDLAIFVLFLATQGRRTGFTYTRIVRFFRPISDRFFFTDHAAARTAEKT